MPSEILIISPKTSYRDELMPRLGKLFQTMQGVQIIGHGATNIKIRVSSGLDLEKNLTKEVLDHCFVEKAKRFSLAS